MSKIDDGGPAFPVLEDRERWDGMSIRDWFAGQALGSCPPFSEFGSAAEVARFAYDIADAMLAARTGKGEKV